MLKKKVPVTSHPAAVLSHLGKPKDWLLAKEGSSKSNSAAPDQKAYKTTLFLFKLFFIYTPFCSPVGTQIITLPPFYPGNNPGEVSYVHSV